MIGQPVGGPLDRCLSLAKVLPLPDGTTERERDILWSVLTRHATDRSMRVIGEDYGMSGGAVRATAVRVMQRMGIHGLQHGEPGYARPYVEMADAIVVQAYRTRDQSRPFDGQCH